MYYANLYVFRAVVVQIKIQTPDQLRNIYSVKLNCHRYIILGIFNLMTMCFISIPSFLIWLEEQTELSDSDIFLFGKFHHWSVDSAHLYPIVQHVPWYASTRYDVFSDFVISHFVSFSRLSQKSSPRAAPLSVSCEISMSVRVTIRLDCSNIHVTRFILSDQTFAVSRLIKVISESDTVPRLPSSQVLDVVYA